MLPSVNYIGLFEINMFGAQILAILEDPLLIDFINMITKASGNILARSRD